MQQNIPTMLKTGNGRVGLVPRGQWLTCVKLQVCCFGKDIGSMTTKRMHACIQGLQKGIVVMLEVMPLVCEDMKWPASAW